jgi:2-dehydropantoate 2-reductase
LKVAIIGAGAIGALFAAHLAQLEDVEVWAYDLAQPHVDAINANGLRLTGAADLVGRVRATSNAKDLPQCDYGIVATKSMHTAAAMQAVAHVFENGAVCSVQNGVGNEEIIAEYVARVIRGTTFPAGHVVEPGVVNMDTGGDTQIGPFEPKPTPIENVRELADAITRGGMPTQALDDARGPQWRKLIFNAASNALGALTGLTHGRLAEFQPVRQVASGIMQEGKAVADVQGIVLDRDPEELFDYAARKDVAYGHKPSMLQDMEAGRQTEIDFLNGAIVEFGERHGVDAPLNRMITALVKGIEYRRENQP